MSTPQYSLLIEATEPILTVVVRLEAPTPFLLTLRKTGELAMGDLVHLGVEGPACAFVNQADRPAKVTATFDGKDGSTSTREIIVNFSSDPTHEQVTVVPLHRGEEVLKGTFVIEPGFSSDKRSAIVIYKVEPPGWET